MDTETGPRIERSICPDHDLCVLQVGTYGSMTDVRHFPGATMTLDGLRRALQ